MTIKLIKAYKGQIPNFIANSKAMESQAINFLGIIVKHDSYTAEQQKSEHNEYH